MNMELFKEIEQGQEDWATVIATQAYIWGYPLVACWRDRLKKARTLTNNEPEQTTVFVNQFQHVRAFSTRESNEFVNAARDFLYSTAVVDLRAGPVRLEMPNFKGRWYGVQVLDAYMETLANLGTRTCGDQVPTTTIALEAQARQSTENHVLSTSPYVYLVVRIAADPSEQLSAVHTLQDGMQIKIEQTTKTAELLEDYQNGNFSLDELPKDDLGFFRELAKVIRFVPPKPEENAFLSLLSEIGFNKEGGLDTEILSPAVRRGMIKAIQLGESILARKVYEVGKNVNGWGILREIGNYHNNYIIRALVARHGIWANIPEESMYFMARTDDCGQVLNGDNSYRIHFAEGQIPPVDAFWSISYYDEQGRIPKGSEGSNVINSDYSNLSWNSDGSLTIIISPTPPESSVSANWLPAQSGLFNLNLRCYNPKEELLTLQHPVPSIQLISAMDDVSSEEAITLGEAC